MKSTILKRIIISQREEIQEKFDKGNIIPRAIDFPKLQSYLQVPNILAITGIRRCGKSVLSWQVASTNEPSAYINFDDERLLHFNADDFDLLLEVFYELYGEFEYIVLDELQNIQGWELFVNRLRRTKKVIITGSNSNLLSGELSTHLTGRYVDFQLMPFSFKEYLLYHNMVLAGDDIYSTQKIGLIKNHLSEYLKEGGFPEVYQLGREMVLRIYADIIEKDILKRNKIKKSMLLKELSQYLVSNSSQEFSFNRLKNIYAIKDINTARRWVWLLENSFLIFILERFSYKLKERILAPKKIYCIDTGMKQIVGFDVTENKGSLLENAVAIELKRRKYYFDSTMEIYYWKNYNNKEVDFVIKKGKTVQQLIQVCYDLGTINTREREFKSLYAAANDLDCDDLLIITWDTEGKEEFKGKNITMIPLWKWLLGF
ncbi:MAG: ATP-binding protein [Spirochaetes bacterium]|nr:ATP-binding protein [Spirochaetota bacterium]